VELGLLFARSTPVQFLIVRNVKKNNDIKNNPRKEDDLTASIQNVMASLTPNKLRHMSDA
jgi:hypothetical protein